MKPMPIAVVNDFSEIIEKAKQRQRELEAMSPEERAKQQAATEEVLEKLRGYPGFFEFPPKGEGV